MSSELDEPGTFTLGYSPHAWGMGVWHLRSRPCAPVFPTRVGDGGMTRMTQPRVRSIPHTRGGWG